MQREAWACNLSSGNGLYTSCQSWIRSATGRRSKLTLPISKKPVGLPMLYHRQCFRCLLLFLREDAPIIERHDFHQFFPELSPIIQNLLRPLAASEFRMTGDEATDIFFFLHVFDCLEVHHLQIAPLGE